MFFFFSSTRPERVVDDRQLLLHLGGHARPLFVDVDLLGQLAPFGVVAAAFLLVLLPLLALGGLALGGLFHLLFGELAGGDLVGLGDGLVPDQLGHLQHVHVVVDERQRRERLQVVAVEGEHGAQVADRLRDVSLLLVRARSAAGLVAQDLRQVVARLDRVQRVVLDRLIEKRLGLLRLAPLPGQVTAIGDGRPVGGLPLPDPLRVLLPAALGQHGALIESRLGKAGVAVGDRLERLRDAAALGAREAARLLGRCVALHRLLEFGALVLGDGALLLLGDELGGAGLADRVVLGRLAPHRAGLFAPRRCRPSASSAPASFRSRPPRERDRCRGPTSARGRAAPYPSKGPFLLSYFVMTLVLTCRSKMKRKRRSRMPAAPLRPDRRSPVSRTSTSRRSRPPA